MHRSGNTKFRYRPRFIGRAAGNLPSGVYLTIEYLLAKRPPIPHASSGAIGSTVDRQYLPVCLLR